MIPEQLPFQILRLPKQRRLLGFLVSALSLPFLLGITFGGIAFGTSETVPAQIGLPVFGFLIFFGAAVATKMSAHGKKLRQPDAVSVLEQDQRDPILYLRSFDDEDIVDLTSRTVPGGLLRSEEALCRAFRKIGPVIAIGRPLENLPEVGAARLYVDDRNWQRAVLYFLQRAGAIIIIVGNSPGVWWEIETAMKRADRTRLLFFFPFVEEAATRRSFWHGITPRARILSKKAFDSMRVARDERYRIFKENLDPGLADNLPDMLDEAHFLYFPDASTPRFLKTVRPLLIDTVLQASLTNLKVGIHFERTVKPFIENLRRN